MTAGDADIKLRILSAAKKLFADQGFDKTTIRQICEEAGANVALVSYHFGGKENMFCALFEYYVPKNQIESVDTSLNPVEGVKLIVREVTKFRQNDSQLIRIIQQEVVMNTDRINHIRKYIMPMWQVLRQWLIEGKEQGVFHFRSIDNALMSIVGILLFRRQSDYWSSLLQEEPTTMEANIEDLTSFIFGGLNYKENS